MNLHLIKRIKRKLSKIVLLISAILPLTLVTTATLLPAQSVLAESAQVIEEIVVTARLRDESLQEVPVVVNVLTEDAIRSQRIESISDIGTIVPGMVATQTNNSGHGVIYLRGIGTSTGNPAFEQAVAINLDGLGINNPRLMQSSMFDLKQIDVLRGPQALFFGKNSPGGVIAIHTNDPGDEFELELTGMYESNVEETTLRGIVSGPITDTLGARLAFGLSDADEHWIKIHSDNRFEDGPEGPGTIQTAFETDPHQQEENVFVLATLLWEPTDNFSAKLKYAHLNDERTGATYADQQISWCPYGTRQNVRFPLPDVNDCEADDTSIAPGINPTITWPIMDGRFAGETEGSDERVIDFASLTLTYDMDNFTFTSVTGFFENEELRYGDISLEVASALVSAIEPQLDQLSQELRLVSNLEGNVNFTLGAYYEDKEVGTDLDVIGGFNRYAPALLPLIGNGPFNFGRNAFQQEGTSWSVFAQIGWDINEQWTLAVGGRYTDEEKEIAQRTKIQATPPFGIPAVDWTDVNITNPKNDWDNFSPEVTVSYQYTDDIMFFASYKEGFKSGGFDASYSGLLALSATLPRPINTYDEELVDGYEVGMKSTLLDGTLRLNVTAYTYDYEELQLARFDGTTLSFTIFNGGQSSADGLEVETYWVTPVDGLTLTANLAFADSKFDEFIAPCWAGQTIARGCDTPLPGNNFGSDRSGESLPFASDLSATLGLDYNVSLSDNWNLALNLNAAYTDEFNPMAGTPPEEVIQDSYWWINAAVSLYSSDDKWEVFVRGVNLTDETYRVAGVAAPGYGNAATTGTTDESGLPDFLSNAAGGKYITVGLTFRP